MLFFICSTYSVFIIIIFYRYNINMKSEKRSHVATQSVKLKHYRWAFKMFALSLCLSLLFSLLSQSILSRLGAVFACLMIGLFIFISVVFDMIGIAATSANEDYFKSQLKNQISGADIGMRMIKNSEKVCSFCADVVGDICGILSGAGGACVIMSIAKNISNPSVVIIVSTLVSSLIAGLTILSKALMKERAIKNANKIILRLGKILDKIFFRKKQKNSEKNVDK